MGRGDRGNDQRQHGRPHLATNAPTLCTDENEKALKRVVDFARQYGISKHGLQVGHAGRKGSTKPPAAGANPLKAEEGAWETLAPSAIPYGPDWHVPRAMTADEHEVDAQRLHRHGEARRADRLRPARTARRARLSAAPVSVAAVQPAHRRIWRQPAKAHALSARSVRGGPQGVAERQAARHPRLRGRLGRGRHTVEDTVAFAKELKALGCDYMDVSSGQLDARQKIPFAPHFNAPFAERVRKEAGSRRCWSAW